MNEFIRIFFSLSVSGTLMIILLLLLKPLYKNRLSKKWQYYIWLAVIVRLLIPFTTKTDIITSICKQLNTKPVHIEISSNLTAVKNIMADDNADTKTTVLDATVLSLNKTSNNTAKITIPLYKKIFSFIKQNIFFIWLIVAVSLFIRKITEYQNFIKYIKAGQSEINNFKLWEQLGNTLEKSHINTNVKLYYNSLISSPLLIGFFKPYIIIPTTEIQDTDFQYTIQHELIHYKRKDMFYKWLTQFAICLHWFNPFLYIMGHEINKLCELSCDEAVIKNLSEKERTDYGETLLNAVCTKNSFKSPISSVTLSEGTKLLKERLDSIMKFQKKTKLCTTITFIFACTLTIFLCVTATAFGNTLIKDNDKLENTQLNKSFQAAKPTSNTANDYNIIDEYIENDKVILDNGKYYILYGNATKKDMPSGGVTDGCIAIILVEKDGYSSFGPFDIKEMDTIVSDIKELCSNWIKSTKSDNQKKAKVVIGLATKLKENNGKIENIKDISLKTDYKKWGIKIKNDNYYYDNKRIRVLVELNANGDFSNFKYDKKGTVDLKLILNKKGKIKKLMYLSEKEAKKYIDGV